jgi:hypothetical protein
MVCQRCGNTVAASAIACQRCGASLVGVGGILTPPQAEMLTARNRDASADQLTIGGVVDQPTYLGSVDRPTAPSDATPPAGFPGSDDPLTRLPGVDDKTVDDNTIGLGSSSSDRPAGRKTRVGAPRRVVNPSGDDGPLAVGQAFGPRYHIIRLLGIGGMGAVYQAWDAELGVAVAIKVIRPEAMADPTTAAEIGRRFKRELLLARQVTHKNVVRIHDLGDIDDIKYITTARTSRPY